VTEVTIDRVGDSYVIDYSADNVEIRDAQKIIELIADLYDRQGSAKIGDDFIVSNVEFHGYFKVRE